LEPELWSSTSLAKIAALTHRTGNLCLDKAFDLIEGHPDLLEMEESKGNSSGKGKGKARW